MIVGEVKKMGKNYYICLNEKGTLEKIRSFDSKRVLLWHFRNFFKPFKSIQETKEFLKIRW